MPEFNEKAMGRMVEINRYLGFVFKDFSKRNVHLTERNILEVLFNSYVLEDSLMESIYLDELEKMNIK